MLQKLASPGLSRALLWILFTAVALAALGREGVYHPVLRPVIEAGSPGRLLFQILLMIIGVHSLLVLFCSNALNRKFFAFVWILGVVGIEITLGLGRPVVLGPLEVLEGSPPIVTWDQWVIEVTRVVDKSDGSPQVQILVSESVEHPRVEKALAFFRPSLWGTSETLLTGLKQEMTLSTRLIVRPPGRDWWERSPWLKSGDVWSPEGVQGWSLKFAGDVQNVDGKGSTVPFVLTKGDSSSSVFLSERVVGLYPKGSYSSELDVILEEARGRYRVELSSVRASSWRGTLVGFLLIGVAGGFCFAWSMGTRGRHVDR